jgi:hypothetical protein
LGLEEMVLEQIFWIYDEDLMVVKVEMWEMVSVKELVREI